MAQTLTLIDGVVEVMKKARLIESQDTAPTTLVYAPLQPDVDIIVEAWNTVIHQMYSFSDDMPTEIKEGTITLATGTREYVVASDFEALAKDIMVDQTNGYYLTPYKGGFAKMFEEQLQPASWTGNPTSYVISPVNQTIRLNTVPTAGENGRVYTYLYVKTLSVRAYNDGFPFSDEVVYDLVPAVKEYWSQSAREQFNPGTYSAALAIAARKVSNKVKRTHY